VRRGHEADRSETVVGPVKDSARADAARCGWAPP